MSLVTCHCFSIRRRTRKQAESEGTACIPRVAGAREIETPVRSSRAKQSDCAPTGWLEGVCYNANETLTPRVAFRVVPAETLLF